MVSDIKMFLEELRSLRDQLMIMTNPKAFYILLNNIVEKFKNPVLKIPIKLIDQAAVLYTEQFLKLEKKVEEELKLKQQKILEYIERVGTHIVSEGTLNLLKSDNPLELGLIYGMYSALRRAFIELNKSNAHQTFIQQNVKILPEGKIDERSISSTYDEFIREKALQSSQLFAWRSWSKIKEFHDIYNNIAAKDDKRWFRIAWEVFGEYSESSEVKDFLIDEYKLYVQNFFNYLRDNILEGILPDTLKFSQKDLLLKNNCLIIHGNRSKQFAAKDNRRLELLSLLILNIYERKHESCVYHRIFSKDLNSKDSNFLHIGKKVKKMEPLDNSNEQRQLRDLIRGINERILEELFIRDFLVYENHFISINPLHIKQ